VKRRFIFRHYWWIAPIGAGAGISVVLAFATNDRIPLVGSVIAATLAFCYFVQQQKLAETGLFKELFTEFNKRYDDLNDGLVRIAGSNGSLNIVDRQVIVDYCNLCGEEYLFYSEGYIHQHAWRSWCRGMLWYLEREPFRAVWEEEVSTDSFYGLTLEIIRQGAV
jgi:hypothetical protein